MKLKFKQQGFQTDAVNAVCALFDGQQQQTSIFGMEQDGGQAIMYTDMGTANRLHISDEQIIENMRTVQMKNSLPQTADLQGRQFSIEMETGTGKTYVYTKTIYELNRLYGFTKFIVVVPSVAIREGVYKSLQITQDHFSAIYDNTPCRFFIYNSSKLSDVRQFASNTNIEIMIINIDAFRKAVTARSGTDLQRLSGGRSLYDGYVLSGIDCTPGMEQIEFSNTEVVQLHQAIGDVDENLMKRMQIRRTIEAHLEKELRYTEKGIKVLSLFFIDEVKKYREPESGKGIYAQMFEEEYAALLALPKYAELREQFPSDVSAVHNGYFSQDKKGRYKDTRGDTQDDYNTYNIIMKDKEWLLSFDCPLRFIFSHSALKEGWDNPNVFQVCTLVEQKSTLTARQKVGRGLRLCVNQNGERIDDRNINLLHVMANESFAEFADNLQKEIEDETGIKLGVLQLGLFSGMVFEEAIWRNGR